MDLKHLLKRGALLAAANWPVVVIQFIAETTFQVLLAVPVIGAALLVALLLGTDIAELVRGSTREMFAAVAGALMSEPVALVAFIAAFVVVLLGGSVFMFVIKGGTVDVLLAANADAGPVERQPLTYELFRSSSRFTLERFTAGCARMYPPYIKLGIGLMIIYAISGAAYLAFVVYGYRIVSGRALIIGWTLIAAMAAGVLIGWITLINLVYLLVQVALAVEGRGIRHATRAVGRFARAEFRELAAVFLVVFALVVVATLASALAWTGVGLIAFVPLVGLAVFPLQLAALAIRGLAFQYLGLTALGAYITLYAGYVSKRQGDAVPVPTSVAPLSAEA